MNLRSNAFVVCCFLLLTGQGFGASQPTFHALGQHHCAMLLVPPSDQPVTIKVTDPQQQVFLYLTLEAADGVEERINFARMPAGPYYIEVQYEEYTFFKVVYVQNSHVNAADASVDFQTTRYFQP